MKEWRRPKNEEYPKNEDIPQKDDDPKKEDNPKNEKDPKNKTTLKMKMTQKWKTTLKLESIQNMTATQKRKYKIKYNKMKENNVHMANLLAEQLSTRHLTNISPNGYFFQFFRSASSSRNFFREKMPESGLGKDTPKVVFHHQRLSFTQGCLPAMVIFHP